QGIGFAIPINAAKLILPQLRETGQVIRGWLGVAVQELTPELAQSFGLKEAKGALVSEVIINSPAAKAGIRPGDVILFFSGKPVTSVGDLPRIVAATPVGDQVNVGIHRDGKRLEVAVTVAKMEDQPRKEPATGALETLGLTVSDITPEAQRYYRLKKGSGALVTAIDPVGPAAEANLRPGDLIVEINGQPVANADSFSKLVAQAKPGTVLRLLVQRGDGIFFTTLPKK
ncbi:MAG: PDZ domain-containing protein, partial [Desulfuromonadales bacterium]|nr:PDZ domain-containing protein [Desulfuromonadales bacterium]